MDNLNDRGPRDRNRISLSEDWEVKWWTASLGVSVNELKEVVAIVGNSTTKVKEYLHKKK